MTNLKAQLKELSNVIQNVHPRDLIQGSLAGIVRIHGIGQEANILIPRVVDAISPVESCAVIQLVVDLSPAADRTDAITGDGIERLQHRHEVGAGGLSRPALLCRKVFLPQYYQQTLNMCLIESLIFPQHFQFLL